MTTKKCKHSNTEIVIRSGEDIYDRKCVVCHMKVAVNVGASDPVMVK